MEEKSSKSNNRVSGTPTPMVRCPPPKKKHQAESHNICTEYLPGCSYDWGIDFKNWNVNLADFFFSCVYSILCHLIWLVLKYLLLNTKIATQAFFFGSFDLVSFFMFSPWGNVYLWYCGIFFEWSRRIDLIFFCIHSVRMSFLLEVKCINIER